MLTARPPRRLMYEHADFPCWMIVASGKFGTARSPEDHQDGLVICYSEAAAQRSPAKHLAASWSKSRQT
jgi:hypothetical protein